MVTEVTARKALQTFRKEQQKRTLGRYTGCYCDGCVESMKLAIESIKEDLARGNTRKEG